MADNLRQIFHAFNPEKALNGEELQKYYVGFEENEKRIARLRTRLELCLETNEPMKLLFMGHRGSGKTTALNKLVSGLDDAFFIVSYDVIDLLDPNDVKYTDVLLSALAKLTEKTISENISLSKELTGRIEKWGRTLVRTNTETEEMGAGFGVNIPFYFINLFARMKSESQTRYEVREEIKPRVSELISIINDTVFEIEKTGKQVLIIIDNLEKTEYENAMSIFVEHGTQITQPMCKIIYTFPIALRSCDRYSQIRINFSADIMYPSIKIHDKQGNLTEEALKNRDFMKDIFERRGDLELIEGEALELAIDMSGGVLREYIRIIRDAALNAITFDKEKIDMDCVNDVIKDLKNTYRSQLSDEDYVILAETAKNRCIRRDGNLVRLLHNLSVLEYANDENWCDINPVVRLIMEENH
ncbi:P-loop NTPase fold protein [Methanolobus sp. WCC1]|uniref:P-loop NTPase fold protein n=1 Tax=unclassified Methanolobus TaxID=2629569 RepID=UPI0032535798